MQLLYLGLFVDSSQRLGWPEEVNHFHQIVLVARSCCVVQWRFQRLQNASHSRLLLTITSTAYAVSKRIQTVPSPSVRPSVCLSQGQRVQQIRAATARDAQAA